MNWKKTAYKRSCLFKIPNISGVYVIAEEIKVSECEYFEKNLPLYVGKSINLNRRITQHMGESEKNKNLFHLHIKKELDISWLVLPDSEIHSKEKNLIKTLNPMFNKLGLNNI